MKDIPTIVLRLTVSCLLAAVVMGTTFVLTNKAKTHNRERQEQQVMLGLLGYSANRPAPPSLAMHALYRYLVTENATQSMGWLVPVAGGAFVFVNMDLDGKFISQTPVAIDTEKAAEEAERLTALQAAVGKARSLRYTDSTIVVTNEGRRSAYLLPGKFPGFKTFISVMLALDQGFAIRGLEIMEHEEDPGLGAEIKQKYFKNQFKAKPLETIRRLEVAKTPLPEEYRQALEAGEGGALTPEQVAELIGKYKDKDIYALTGATISSRAVTSGVKAMVLKFSYRLGVLDRVLAEQGIRVEF